MDQVPEEVRETEDKDESDEGVQVEEEDDWSLERKMRIDSALDWLQRELVKFQ